MRNIIILSIFLLTLSICAFLTSCDDFFSPTIEIFNIIEQDLGQSQNQEQKNSTDTIVINNQECQVN